VKEPVSDWNLKLTRLAKENRKLLAFEAFSEEAVSKVKLPPEVLSGRIHRLGVIIPPIQSGVAFMHTRKPINIPVVSATEQQGCQVGSNCDERETVALMVLGVSMEPEFMDGEMLVVDMGGQPYEGAFVIAMHDDEHTFRQLKRNAHGGWLLHALNPVYPDVAIAGLEVVLGVITQKKKPGSRKSVKFYEPQIVQ
jgi:hypothetical protein